MTRSPKDEAREERIIMEVIVDAYGPEEQAIGWYNYLDEQINSASGTIVARSSGREPSRPCRWGTRSRYSV